MFLGHHTIAETNLLMADVDHRFRVVDKALQEGLSKHAELAALQAPWRTLLSRWDSDVSKVKTGLVFKRGVTAIGGIGALAVGDDHIPSEDEYNIILDYVQNDSGDPNFHPNDSLRGLQLQIEKILAKPIDVDTGRPALDPNQQVADPDGNFLANPTVNTIANAGGAIASAATNPQDHTLRNVGIGAAVAGGALLIAKLLL